MHIHVLPVQDNPKFRPFLATLPSNHLTVLDLKQVIQSKWVLHPLQQLLYYEYTMLATDSRALSAYNVPENGQVMVGFTTASVSLFIVPIDPTGRKVKLTGIDLNITVNDLKREGAKKMKDLSEVRVQLSLEDEVLKGDELLKSLKALKNESTLQCVINEVGGT